MEQMLDSEKFEAAFLTLARTIADALNEFVSSASAHPGKLTTADEVESDLGVRQRQIVELEGLAAADGMRVAEITHAIGYDAANAHLTLRALERRGLVELVPGKTPQHWRLSPSARQRRRVWEAPELILALDLYVRHGVNPPQEELERTKEVLDRWALAHGHRPRPIGGLVFKLGNFHSLATGGREGFPHGGAADREVWNQYEGDIPTLAEAAAALMRDLEAAL